MMIQRPVAETQAKAASLDPSHPPEQALATIEGCAAGEGGACVWSAFEALARKAIILPAWLRNSWPSPPKVLCFVQQHCRSCRQRGCDPGALDS
jgi:hypothetical protein